MGATKLSSPSSWFEIPVNNFKRAVSFYSTVLNQNLETDNSSGSPCACFTTNTPGVKGNIVQSTTNTPSNNGVRIYFSTNENIEIVLKRVKNAGGRIITNNTPSDDNSCYTATFTDTEGNTIGICSNNS